MRQATIYPAATFQVHGVAADAQAIYLSGANPDLGPERSKSWTAGMDLTPESVRGLRLSLTYYEIDYRDRIVGGGNTIGIWRSEEHTSELQSLMRNAYAVFCLKKQQRTYK